MEQQQALCLAVLCNTWLVVQYYNDMLFSPSVLNSLTFQICPPHNQLLATHRSLPVCLPPSFSNSILLSLTYVALSFSPLQLCACLLFAISILLIFIAHLLFSPCVPAYVSEVLLHIGRMCRILLGVFASIQLCNLHNFFLQLVCAPNYFIVFKSLLKLISHQMQQNGTVLFESLPLMENGYLNTCKMYLLFMQ